MGQSRHFINQLHFANLVLPIYFSLILYYLHLGTYAGENENIICIHRQKINALSKSKRVKKKPNWKNQLFLIDMQAFKWKSNKYLLKSSRCGSVGRSGCFQNVGNVIRIQPQICKFYVAYISVSVGKTKIQKKMLCTDHYEINTNTRFHKSSNQ